jgi:hypothetical protein
MNLIRRVAAGGLSSYRPQSSASKPTGLPSANLPPTLGGIRVFSLCVHDEFAVHEVERVAPAFERGIQDVLFLGRCHFWDLVDRLPRVRAVRDAATSSTAVQNEPQRAALQLRRIGTDQNGKVKSKLFSNRSLK